MNLTINFNKEEAEQEVKELLNEAIKEKDCKCYPLKAFAETLILPFLVALLPAILFYFISDRIFAVMGLPKKELLSALLVFFSVFAIVLFVECEDPFKKIKKHRAWKQGQYDSSADSLFCCCTRLSWRPNFSFPLWEKAYNNYRNFRMITEHNILDFSINKDAITFELEHEDHVVFEWDVKLDKIVRSTAVEKDTLSWEKGEIIYTKKYEGGKENEENIEKFGW